MPRDPALAGSAGLFVPTYALWEQGRRCRRSPTWRRSPRTAARIGASFVATLPLYAAFLDDPFDPSPYAPVSRLHWNEVYLDDAALPGRAAAGAGRAHRLGRPGGPPARSAARGVTRPRPVRAGRDRRVRRRPSRRRRPRPLPRRRARRPPTPARPRRSSCAATSSPSSSPSASSPRVESVGAPSWPSTSRSGAIRPATSAGPTASCSRAGMTVGAPPDEFFGDGQDWGFPPQLPGAGRRSGHELWRRLVEFAGRARVDPAHRPRDGRPPAVVDPRRDGRRSTARTCATPARSCSPSSPPRRRARRRRSSARTSAPCPTRCPRRSAAGDVVGMYEEQFALYHTHVLPPIPARSVAGIRTHDMPAFAAAFDGDATGEQYEYRQPRRRRRRPPGRRRARPTCSTPPSSGSPRSDAYATVDRRRRPDRRDRPPQRARPDAAVHVAAAPAATRLGGARRPRRPPATSSSSARLGRVLRDVTQPGRRARPPPLQRRHPPPPAPLPRRPHRRHRHVVRGVGAQRRVGRRARRLRRLARAAPRARSARRASGRATSPARSPDSRTATP